MSYSFSALYIKIYIIIIIIYITKPTDSIYNWYLSPLLEHDALQMFVCTDRSSSQSSV